MQDSMQDEVNAFVPGERTVIEGTAGGPLAGLTFAAKDLFDVAGVPTGAGNEDWARTHRVPTRHAHAVQTLLDAGATLIGKTITDELSLGILGENPFFGTPLNTRAPGRVPGGSSSGSAAAVAAGLCDTALGTDTGGSVRVPASYCGLHGIRPTHGRLDLSGMLAQAPSSDTTGWFARDAETFERVSSALLLEAPTPVKPGVLLVAVDAFGFADPAVTEALAPAVERLAAIVGERREVTMAPPGLSAWARAQRTLQPHEAWSTFREWIDRENPRLAFSVTSGLLAGAASSKDDRRWASLMRAEARARMTHLLRGDTVLCLPTTPTPAPAKGLSIEAQQPIRLRITSLCAHGGLTGVPQLSIPGAEVDGAPVGLSIIAARGQDMRLVALARALENET